MMNFDEVLKALEASKGDGTWLAVSQLANVHYDTVARIARRAMERPSVQVVERIAAALEQIGKAKAAA